MLHPVRILALGAVLAASPALAQISVGGQTGVNVGVGVGVNPGATVGNVTGSLDRTVGTVDRTVNGSVNGALGSGLRVATGADLSSGAVIRDSHGRQIGVVQSVSGNAAVVARGGHSVRVPISQLYRSSTGLVTRLTNKQIDAMISAQAQAGGTVRN